MVMKAWRPSMWLPLIMLAWGIVITLTGIVQNFKGLFVARIFVSGVYRISCTILMASSVSPKRVSSPVCRITSLVGTDDTKSTSGSPSSFLLLP